MKTKPPKENEVKSETKKADQKFLPAPKKEETREEIKEEVIESSEEKIIHWTKRHLPSHVFPLFALLLLIGGFISIFYLHFIFNIQYQKSTNPFSDGPVTSAPKSIILDLQQPDDNALVFEASMVVSGKTNPNIDVLISTDSIDLILRSKSDGTFSTVLHLDEGVNRIMAVVFDPTGDSRKTEKTVFYSKEKI